MIDSSDIVLEARGDRVRVRLHSGEHAVFGSGDIPLLRAALALLEAADEGWRPLAVGGVIPAEIMQTPRRGGW
jgi:hypothetical protein